MKGRDVRRRADAAADGFAKAPEARTQTPGVRELRKPRRAGASKGKQATGSAFDKLREGAPRCLSAAADREPGSASRP